MGDLGVRSSSRSSSNQQPSTALARLTDHAPGILQQAAGAIAAVDQKLDKLPIVPFITPAKPTSSERVAAGVMSVVYTAGAGVSFIPFVGAWGASALIAGGGFVARKFSPNPEVQNQGNLALQTSAYAAAAGFFGWGSVPYARAAIKSALIAFNKG